MLFRMDQIVSLMNGSDCSIVSPLALVFKYFRQSWAKLFLGPFFGGSTITLIMRVRQASACGRVLALCPVPSAPKQWKSDVYVKS